MYSRLAVTELIVQALVDLEQEWPMPRWKLEVQRRRLLETMNAEDMEEAQEALQMKREDVNEEILEVARIRSAIDEVGELDDGDRQGELVVRYAPDYLIWWQVALGLSALVMAVVAVPWRRKRATQSAVQVADDD